MKGDTQLLLQVGNEIDTFRMGGQIYGFPAVLAVVVEFLCHKRVLLPVVPLDIPERIRSNGVAHVVSPIRILADHKAWDRARQARQAADECQKAR